MSKDIRIVGEEMIANMKSKEQDKIRLTVKIEAAREEYKKAVKVMKEEGFDKLKDLDKILDEANEELRGILKEAGYDV